MVVKSSFYLVRLGGNRVTLGKVGHFHLLRSTEELAVRNQNYRERQGCDCWELTNVKSHNGGLPGMIVHRWPDSNDVRRWLRFAE